MSKSPARPSAPAQPSTLDRVLAYVGSMKLATWLFILLGILTLAGTLEQQHMSLYDVQAKYFESIVLVWWAGDTVPIPLLGGYLLLSILFFNLLVGGVLRIRKGKATVGVIIAHVGILSLLLGSFVEHQFSTKGQMTLFVNETDNEYSSVHEWEVTVAAPHGDGQREYVIPWESFRDLDAGEQVVWTHADLPFDVVLSDVTRNGQPQPARPGDTHAIDGFVLARLKPVGMGNRVNVPALIATLRPKSGGGAMRSILWGVQDYPWDPTVGGTRYYVDLRRRTWQVPFAVRLDKFEHEKYPGTRMAKRYSSYVTKVDGATEDKIHITMNEPMRWRGYTFYQSDYGPKEGDPPGTPEYSTLSVVKNPADKWPEWMLYFLIAPGMALHFILKMAKWSERQRALNARRKASVALVLVGALLFSGCDNTVGTHSGWSEETQQTVARVPVQASGRIKPLSTWVAFALLGMNQKRSCENAAGEKLKPVEWFLDTAFRPDVAKTHRCFAVTTSGSLEAVGAHDAIRGKKKRDRYAYEDFVTPDTRARLAQLGSQWHKIEPKNRSPEQQGVVDLDNGVAYYEGVQLLFAWAQTDFPLEGESLVALFGGKQTVTFSEIMEKAGELVARARAGMGKDPNGEDATKEALAISGLLSAAFSKVEHGLRVGLFPPTAKVELEGPTWLTLRDVAGFAFLRGAVDPQHLELLKAMEAMARAGDDKAAFHQAAERWQAAGEALAAARGEYREVAREVTFYASAPFDNAIGFYGLGLLVALVSLLLVRLRWLPWLTLALTVVGLGIHTWGIVLRCLIRGRPPVSTLYETVVFIGASGVLALLVLEWFSRRGIALKLAPVLGVGMLLLAGRYEVLNGTDTMPQLVAVLDTNYWLTIHVICITIGYMAGLVAALIAHVYVFVKLLRGKALARLFGVEDMSREWYRDVVTMVYGTLCFALVTSLVGTILGGVWANDSWGRFWGWDPKENGALLICLAQLAILHARMSGMIKQLGLCLATIFQGMIVGFSWWGVNLLGIGLHSYGFTSGIFTALMSFYLIEGAVLLAGFYVGLKERMPESPAAAEPPPLEGSSSS